MPDGQQPPGDQQTQQPPAEKPDCVKSNTSWTEKGKATAFAIELVNSCNMKLRCTVDAFIIGSKGQAQGHGTLILDPAGNGQTTSKTYSVPVKSAGGMASLSHTCKAI